MISKVDDNIFEIGTVHYATQFTRLLMNIVDYVQIKYNSDMAEAIETIEAPTFTYPEKPTVSYVKDKTKNIIEIKADEWYIFMRRRP